MKKSLIKDILYGCAVGDALGVPYEFKKGNSFCCMDMTGYGTHCQPKGTWSDDTSMTLCLADCIADGFSVEKLADNFLKWYEKSEYTAGGNLFDIGNATACALRAIRSGVSCLEAGGTDEWSNGNGSLMRIAPLAIYTKDMTVVKRFDLCRQVSSLTHRHPLSVSACFIYLEFLRSIVSGDSLEIAFDSMIKAKESLHEFGVEDSVVSGFSMLAKNLKNRKRNEIKSSGFVVDTLVASVWCVLTTDSYKEAVLKAVNLGDDTDTTGAVTGVIAGLVYGYETIPESWLLFLKNKKLIDFISEKFERKFCE